ncbi:excinuclease ABC subunit A [Virgisporangium aliadipatigenens]|uniref:UvrABC system protein A n=1 Tax=Virgisporangium aliadipatigenens TaxID=741659 RepID=A0A8J3YKB2_9ACTN|nr:excinuclease ABC subunit UvrA [Virgisporangium aliadipatigenens]GIJ45560.1 excinuclease ABC subunit A [Virgisporangium aliadipatigenens]
MNDEIVIEGARENNLRGVSVRIPKRTITAFTGVSGSGKSSLVFDTIAAEAGRQLNETFTMFQRNFLPRYGQPAVDRIENLSAAIVVDQRRLGGGSRSTVGTVTDIYTLLRLLYSRAGRPFVGYSNAFSFNDPQGMCPECEGLGRATTLDLEKFLDRSKSLNDGAIRHPDFKVGTWYWKLYAASGLFDPDLPIEDYPPERLELFLHAIGEKIPVEWQGGTINASYEGVVARFTRLYIKKDAAAMSERNRAVFQRFITTVTCPLCKGARLSQAALACEIEGWSIADLAAMEATELVSVLRLFTSDEAEPVVVTLVERLRELIDMGLGYLSLDRATSSLSGGESQRVKMVRHLASSLTDMMYVFDEPSVGLHARDVRRLNDLLAKLRDKGNTVLVVEHDPDVIESADFVVDLGPRAGAHGGEIVYTGTVAGLARTQTLTGEFLRHRMPLKELSRQRTGVLPVRGANAHNLLHVDVDFPTGVLTVVTGVAGSGKSSLVNGEFLKQHPGAVVIDQSAVGVSSRSNPATYTGIMDEIRKLFAKANGVAAGLFSFNSTGACPTCQGHGVIYTDLAYLEAVRTPCETCRGRRFRPEVLEYTLRGKSISDVLDLTTEEAAAFFAEKKLKPVLSAMAEVGLDYLTLGQPLSTLSGGECQRIKLATQLHKEGAVYVLDEPTTGLHMSDVGHLLRVFDRLVDGGNSVIVIEHNLDVIKNADWIVDLGPEGGTGGGRVVFEGTPRQMVDGGRGHTADHLRRAVG